MHAKLVGDLEGEGLIRNELEIGTERVQTKEYIIVGTDSTDDKEKDGKISQIFGMEYLLVLADGMEKTIRPARIKIYSGNQLESQKENRTTSGQK